MSKPLELTIYPPLSPTVQRGVDYCIEKGRYPYLGFSTEAAVPGIVRMHAKRLADAELCAEFESARCDAMIQRATGSCWAPLGETWSMEPSAIRDRAQTLLRFATHPHYFEEQE